MARSRTKTHPPKEIRRLSQPRRRMIWRNVASYQSTYVHPKDKTITVKVTTLNPPPKTKKMKSAGGVRKFKLTHTTKQVERVLIVARAVKKKAPKKTAPKKSRKDEAEDEELEDEDLDDLEGLEDELDDLEDEDVEEDEDDDEDEDEDEDLDEEDDEDEEDEEDEEPAPKKRSAKSKTSKKSPAKSKPSRSRTTDGKVGTQEVADHCGVDARKLRMVLRKHNIEKDSETGRYEWSSLNHPVVKKIKKLIDSGAASEVQKEKLAGLKKGKKAPAKRTRKKAK